VSEPEFDVVEFEAFDASDDHRPTWGKSGLALVLVCALVLGGLLGLRWGERRESGRRQAAADATLSVSAAVVPGTQAHSPVPYLATVSQQVDIALVNSGPALLSAVGVVWDPVHQAYSQGTEGKVTLSNLSPGEPQRVTLTLRQPCATPALKGVADVPRLVVSARTADGRSRTVTVDPLGMDVTWATMQAACPVNDNAVLTTSVRVTGSAPLGPKGVRLTLTFGNPAAVDVLITNTTITRGADSSSRQQPRTLQVFPHFSAAATVTFTISDCRAAILDDTPIQVSYAVRSVEDLGNPNHVATGDPSLSRVLSGLLYRACARP
jgi:hypothetical protein